MTNEFVTTLQTGSTIIRLLVYEPYRNFINTNKAGCFDNEHLSHKNAIESEGDSTGLLTHVVCRISAGYLLCTFYLSSTFHGTKRVVACISRYGDVFAEMCKDLQAAYETCHNIIQYNII